MFADVPIRPRILIQTTNSQVSCVGPAACCDRVATIIMPNAVKRTTRGSSAKKSAEPAAKVAKTTAEALGDTLKETIADFKDSKKSLQDLCAHLLGHTYQFKDGQRGKLIKFTVDGVDNNTKITAAGARGEFLMELDENEMSTVRAKCEKDYPQHDVTEVMYRGYARRTLLDHYRLEYPWNGCSGQLLLNARRVP